MNLSRWFYKATAGVEDFVEGADDEEITSRRNYVYWTIDHSSFQKWVVFVAGVGFFTDAYDLFALNVVLPILGFVYWDGEIPQSYETALICATLAGTLIGQVLFGVLADIHGRRKIYGLELLVVIFATLGVAMSATGERKSMDIVGWLIFWRFTMGIGRDSSRSSHRVFYAHPSTKVLGGTILSARSSVVNSRLGGIVLVCWLLSSFASPSVN